MKYSITELKNILNAKKINKINDNEITGIAIDSRKVKKGDLFIPFFGENVNGHNYIEKAFENGAVASLSMDDNFKFNNNIIYVKDSLTAIQNLAEDYLKKLNAKVIAITGSNGKTTTKDIISHFLNNKYNVHKTVGNYNNELGVPITILNANENTEILVLEMGADGFGQIEFLSKLTQPDIAIITNIGESHIEFFKDRNGIAKGKFEIINALKKNGLFIYNGDESLLKNLVNENKINNISCGESSENNIILENYIIDNKTTEFKLNIFKSKLKTNLKGKHNIINIMFAIAVAKQFDINEEDLIKSISSLNKITSMRLEEINYGSGSLIINDAYNASPTSMRAAIDVLENFNNFNQKTLIVGDMFELGSNEEQFHKQIGSYLNNTKTINKVISVGNLAKNITDNIIINSIQKLHFNNLSEVTTYLLNNKKEKEILLFKASRGMAFENIINNIIEV